MERKRQITDFLTEISTSEEKKEQYLKGLDNRRERIAKRQLYLDRLIMEYDKLKMKYKKGGIRSKSAIGLRIVRVKTRLEVEKLKWWESQEILKFIEEGLDKEQRAQFEEQLKQHFKEKRAVIVTTIRAVFTKWDPVIQEKRARYSFEKYRKDTEGDFKAWE